MIDVTKLYADFLGAWDLVPESCNYQQSEPPVSGTYVIREVQGGLTFYIAWEDAEGEKHAHSFTAVPDGQPHAFNGGDLVDALSVTAASPIELNSAAFYQGRELMTATRTLKDGGSMMDVTQSVVLPDGTQPTNTASYRRRSGS